MTFLDQQEKYRSRLQEADPLQFMRKAMEQNLDFWNRMTRFPNDRNE